MINTDSAVYFKFRFVFKELISTTNNNEKKLLNPAFPLNKSHENGKHGLKQQGTLLRRFADLISHQNALLQCLH